LRTDLDFIIAWAGCSDLTDGIKQRVLFRDRLIVFARPGHPVTKGPLSWRELANYPWVSPVIGRQPPLIEQVMSAEGACGPKQITECSSVSFMKTVVENSDHIGILANHVIEDDVAKGRLTDLAIDSRTLNRNIAVFCRERSPLDEASRVFLHHVAETGVRLCRSVNFSRH
jgi:DNA-binding transcriptional LysR family regulator